jgi:hypothetical protein
MDGDPKKKTVHDEYTELYKLDDNSTIFAGFNSGNNKVPD